jgi:hypothetical protein
LVSELVKQSVFHIDQHLADLLLHQIFWQSADRLTIFHTVTQLLFSSLPEVDDISTAARSEITRMASTFLPSASQPGHGSWLLQSKSQQRRGRKKIQSYLLRSSNEIEDAGVPVEVDDHAFLQGNHGGGKGLGSHARQPGDDLTSFPRTIRLDNLLSRPLTSSDEIASDSKASRLLSYLHYPEEPNYKLNSEPTRDTLDDDMAVPPHLRKKKGCAEVTPDGHESTSTLGRRPPDNHASGRVVDEEVNALPTPPQSSEGVDIRQKLEQYGVKVSNPEPATQKLLIYPTSDDGLQNLTDRPKEEATNTWRAQDLHKSMHATNNQNNWQSPSRNPSRSRGRYGSRERGQHSFRGRGRGRGGFQGNRGSGMKWPTAAEQRPDPHRWDIRWDTESEKQSSSGHGWSSNEADAGFGQDRRRRGGAEGGAKLTDWSGGWAPVCPLLWLKIEPLLTSSIATC